MLEAFARQLEHPPVPALDFEARRPRSPCFQPFVPLTSARLCAADPGLVICSSPSQEVGRRVPLGPHCLVDAPSGQGSHQPPSPRRGVLPPHTLPSFLFGLTSNMQESTDWSRLPLQPPLRTSKCQPFATWKVFVSSVAAASCPTLLTARAPAAPFWPVSDCPPVLTASSLWL